MTTGFSDCDSVLVRDSVALVDRVERLAAVRVVFFCFAAPDFGAAAAVDLDVVFLAFGFLSFSAIIGSFRAAILESVPEVSDKVKSFYSDVNSGAIATGKT